MQQDKHFDGRTAAPGRELPACRIDAHGRRSVDLRAVLMLALPMVLNAMVQMVLNLTDTAFVARVSTTAVAGVASVYWLILGSVFLFGGVGMAVQPFAAQAAGSGRWRRASAAAWTGQWAALSLLPVFALLAWAGPRLIAQLGMEPDIADAAVAFWVPRVGAGSLTVVQMAQQCFLYGVGQTRISLLINLLVLASNAALNALLILGLGLGVAGAAWATNLSLALGVLVGFAVIWNREPFRTQMDSRRTWRPRLSGMRTMLVVGLPIGASIAFDMLGLAVFQLLMTRLGVVAGAATQVVMMLTSIAYMPGVGLGSAGTTLVGQSIGAGDARWAWRVGNRVVVMAAAYMGAVGFLLAFAGPVLVRLLVGGEGAVAAETAAVAASLLWIAAWYQLLDGVNLGANFCLRGAGDTRFAAVAMMLLSWGLFLPLVHWLTFAPGEGPVPALSGLGLGVSGGWWGATAYISLLGLVLLARWVSRRWMRMRLH